MITRNRGYETCSLPRCFSFVLDEEMPHNLD